MLRSIKTSFKETVIYSIGNIAVKIVGLILIPLYTNPEYFTIDEFGLLGILEICGLVLTAFMASALPQSLIRWYWDDEFKNNQKGIFFMSYSTQIVVSIIFCLLFIPLSGTFSEIIFGNDKLRDILALVIVASAIQAVNNILNTLMRLQTKSILYSATNLSKLAVVLGLTLYFVIVQGMGLKGIYLAQVTGNSLIVIYLTGYGIRNSSIFFDWKVFKSMSAYGYPLLLANISAVTLTVIDRFALNSFAAAPLKSVALYTLAFKITSVLKLVIVDSMKLAIGPMMIKRMYSSDNKRFYSKVMLYSSYVLMFAITGISAYSYEVIKVLADVKEFWAAVTIIPVLSLSVFFINLKEVTVYGLHIAKKTGIIGTIVVFSALISLGLNILLIPGWDIMGAAIATLLTQLIYWLSVYYFSQRVFHVPYELIKILLIVVAGMIISFACQLFNGMELLPRLLLKTACVFSFPFILLLFNFYEDAEWQAIKGFVKKWSKPGRLGENLKSLKNIRDDF